MQDVLKELLQYWYKGVVAGLQGRQVKMAETCAFSEAHDNPDR